MCKLLQSFGTICYKKNDFVLSSLPSFGSSAMLILMIKIMANGLKMQNTAIKDTVWSMWVPSKTPVAYRVVRMDQVGARWVNGLHFFYFCAFKNVHQLYSGVVIQFFRLLKLYPRVFYIYLHRAIAHKRMFWWTVMCYPVITFPLKWPVALQLWSCSNLH